MENTYRSTSYMLSLGSALGRLSRGLTGLSGGQRIILDLNDDRSWEDPKKWILSLGMKAEKEKDRDVNGSD